MNDQIENNETEGMAQRPLLSAGLCAPWNRCDVCGKFISIHYFSTGVARRELVTPDSAFSIEEYETLCETHNVKVSGAAP